jgi:hypothetical protein
LKPAENKKEVVEEEMDAAEEKKKAAEEEAVGEKKDIEDEKMEAVKGKENQVADYFSRYSIKEITEQEKTKIEINCMNYDQGLEETTETFKTKYIPGEMELAQRDNPGKPFEFQLENVMIIIPTDYQNNIKKVSHEYNAHLGIKRCVQVIKKHIRFTNITKIPQKQFKKNILLECKI